MEEALVVTGFAVVVMLASYSVQNHPALSSIVFMIRGV